MLYATITALSTNHEEIIIMKKEIIDLSVPKKEAVKKKLKPKEIKPIIKVTAKTVLIAKPLKDQRNRKPKLEKVVKEHGGTKAFSEAVGISASTISKLLRTDAPMSDRVATAISALTNGKLSFKVLKRMHIKKD